MAKNSQSVGKGRVVTPAPKSANGKSATSKKAGVTTRKPKDIRSAVVRQNAINASRRVRQFATDDALHDLLTNLSRKVMPAELVNDTTKEGAKNRREWCVKNGALIVHVYDDGISARRANYAPINANGFRPENAIRERLLSLVGIGVEGFGYTRCETNWVQYQKACALDWENYDPDTFTYEGADTVFLYRV